MESVLIAAAGLTLLYVRHQRRQKQLEKKDYFQIAGVMLAFLGTAKVVYFLLAGSQFTDKAPLLLLSVLGFQLCLLPEEVSEDIRWLWQSLWTSK